MFSYSYFLFVYLFTSILKMKLNIHQYFPSFYAFYEIYFPESDTCPIQVGVMDPWPVTWPNLSDLIG